MAAFFKKKSKKEKDQDTRPPDVEAQSAMPSEVKQVKLKKKSFFGKKEKGEKKQKKEKPAKKKRVKKEKVKKEKVKKQPRLSSKEKKRAARESQMAAAVAEPAETAAGAGAVPKSDGTKKGKKGRFGKKKDKAAKKGVKEKKKDKKEKQKEKKTKAPKGKKPKEKKKKGFGGSKLSPIGLDIGRTSLTAVRLRHQTAGSVLLSVVMDRIPEGLIQEGEVRDVEALSNAIKKFWKSYKIKGRKVNLGLANQKIVVRTFEFPILDGKELRSAIDLQAQDYIPIPMDQAVIDFHVLGRFTDDEGIEKQKVLVVAAQKEMVLDFIKSAKKAKLSVVGIDLQAFAMIRSLVSVSFLDEKTQAGQAVAVANVASDVTNLVVDVGGEPQFTRIISFGGDDFTRSVQEQTGVSYKKAEQLKAMTGLLHPSEIAERGPLPEEHLPEEQHDMDIEPKAPGSGSPNEGPQEPVAPPAEEDAAGESGKKAPDDDDDAPLVDVDDKLTAATRRALEITTESFAEEIRRSLDYYLSQEESLPVGKMLLSGGGAMLRNLDAHLANVFPFPVELGNPLMRISQNRTDLSDEELSAIAPHLAIAIGLTLEDEV